MALEMQCTPQFKRDMKILKKKRADLGRLDAVLALIAENTPEARETLMTNHGMHQIIGRYRGSNECHIGTKRDDLVVVWDVCGDSVVLRRTGSHDKVFR